MALRSKSSQASKRYGAVRALDGVSLAHRAKASSSGCSGPNGAGKTTLISLLAGLARADSGSSSVMGHDVVREYRRARRALGVVPQELVFDPFFTVRETLRIQSGYFGLRAQRCVDRRGHRIGSISPTRPQPTCARCRAA